MSWALGYDARYKRDIGYGVPARCDHPECTTEIDRGLSHVCEGEPYGGDQGCGLYFCERHLSESTQRCERCTSGGDHFPLSDDLPEWVQHKQTDPSWQAWRDENQIGSVVTEATLQAAITEADRERAQLEAEHLVSLAGTDPGSKLSHLARLAAREAVERKRERAVNALAQFQIQGMEKRA